ARNRGDEHDALAVGDEDRAERLLGKPTGFEGKRLPVDGDGFADEGHGGSLRGRRPRASLRSSVSGRERAARAQRAKSKAAAGGALKNCVAVTCGGSARRPFCDSGRGWTS